MARIARVVAPGVPHHVTQRGNRKQRTFFCHKDFRIYKKIMAEWCKKHKVEIWTYCLMPNHVHLIAVPSHKESLTRAIAETHRRYTLMINTRHGWQGCLWQGRYFSFPMDETHLSSAVRYVELNPVRAGLVKNPEDYPWSSARAHIKHVRDDLLSSNALVNRIDDWQAFLGEGIEQEQLEQTRLHQRTGRPCGAETFIEKMEQETGRIIKARKRGPKARQP
ncbi:MAG: transposase [Thermoleophilia bacterium]|nr:transposase [Thermoleophilia bacterium]